MRIFWYAIFEWSTNLEGTQQLTRRLCEFVIQVYLYTFMRSWVQAIVATCCEDWCMPYHYPSSICTSHMCTILPCWGTCWWYHFACRNNLISWKLHAYNDNNSYGTLFIAIGIFHLANLYFKNLGYLETYNA